MVFFEKLDEIYSKYQQLSQKMADPAVIADSSVWTSLAKEQAEISETAEKYAEYKEAARRLTDTAAALKDESDPEMRILLSEEEQSLKKQLQTIEGELESSAPSQGQERRKELYSRNPRRRGRRRGGSVRRRTLQNVPRLLRKAPLEDGGR